MYLLSAKLLFGLVQMRCTTTKEENLTRAREDSRGRFRAVAGDLPA